MSLTVLNSTAFFVKYAGPDTRDRSSAMAVIIYVDNNDIDTMTFRSLDRLARSKRYASSDMELHTCAIISVKLEKLDEKNCNLITVTAGSMLSIALDKDMIPIKPIIWFELSLPVVMDTKISVQRPVLSKRKLTTDETAATSKRSATSSAVNENSHTNKSALKIPTGIVIPGKEGSILPSADLPSRPSSVRGQSVSFHPEVITQNAPLSNPTFAVRKQDQNLVSVLETIGINPGLISRNFTTACNPIPTNLPSAPKILKNAGNYELKKDRVRKDVIMDNEEKDVGHEEKEKKKEKETKNEDENNNENEEMYVTTNYWGIDDTVGNEIDTHINNDKKEGGKHGTQIRSEVDKDDIYNDYSDNDYEIDTTDTTIRDDITTSTPNVSDIASSQVGGNAAVSLSVDKMEEVKEIVMGVNVQKDSDSTPDNSNLKNQTEALDNDDNVEMRDNEVVVEEVEEINDGESPVEVEAGVAMKKSRKLNHESGRKRAKKNESNTVVLSEKEIENQLLFLTNRIPKSVPVLWGVRTPDLVIERKKINQQSKKNRRKNFKNNSTDDNDETEKPSDLKKDVIAVSEPASNEHTSDFLSDTPVERHYFKEKDNSENEIDVKAKASEIIEKRIGREFQADVIKGIPGHSDYIDGYISELSDEGDANDPADDPMHTHMWCNDKLNKSLVESFWNNFKAEQLASVVEGDIVWDYSQIIDMKIPSLPDVKKRGGGVVARYTDFDYNENDDDFESMTNRGPKSGTVKPKLVCVTKNFRTFNKLDGDLAELMVFDGTEEYSVISYQCEPIDGLSYHFLPEERALQLFSRYKGDLAKTLQRCRFEIEESRKMCWGNHQYYCKKRRLHLTRPRHYRRDNKPLRKADYGEYSETEEEEDRVKQEEYDRKYDEKIAEKKRKKKEAKELQGRLADIPEQGNETVAPNSDHPSSSTLTLPSTVDNVSFPDNIAAHSISASTVDTVDTVNPSTDIAVYFFDSSTEITVGPVTDESSPVVLQPVSPAIGNEGEEFVGLPITIDSDVFCDENDRDGSMAWAIMDENDVHEVVHSMVDTVAERSESDASHNQKDNKGKDTTVVSDANALKGSKDQIAVTDVRSEDAILTLSQDSEKSKAVISKQEKTELSVTVVNEFTEKKLSKKEKKRKKELEREQEGSNRTPEENMRVKEENMRKKEENKRINEENRLKNIKKKEEFIRIAAERLEVERRKEEERKIKQLEWREAEKKRKEEKGEEDEEDEEEEEEEEEEEGVDSAEDEEIDDEEEDDEDDDDDDELADGRSEESFERYLLYMWDDGISVNEDSEIEKNQGVLHWNTARRWVDKKMKYFLEAVIDPRKLSRQMEIINNDVGIIRNPIAHMKTVTYCDFSLLYNLIGEPYVMDQNTNGKVIREVTRDPQWSKTFFEVLKKSSTILNAELAREREIRQKKENEQERNEVLAAGVTVPQITDVVVAEEIVTDELVTDELITDTSKSVLPMNKSLITDIVEERNEKKNETEIEDRNDDAVPDYSENDVTENDVTENDVTESGSTKNDPPPVVSDVLPVPLKARTEPQFPHKLTEKSSPRPLPKLPATTSTFSRLSKAPPPTLLTAKNVVFSDSNGGTGTQKSGSAAAFERLEQQSLKEKPSTSLLKVTEEELCTSDFIIFHVKFDCSTASQAVTGLVIEGAKGTTKEVLEYHGRSEDLQLLKVGDYLLSIDGNDVKDMSMIGLSNFLQRRIEHKMLLCKGYQPERISFGRRYVKMSFRRKSILLTKHKTSKPIIDKSKKRELDRMSLSVDEGTHSSSSAKRSKVPQTVNNYSSTRQINQNAQEGDFLGSSSPIIDDGLSALDEEICLIKRMKVGCRIFLDDHPAEVLEIDIETLRINVRWASGQKGWISIDADRMLLQEDIVYRPRRR